MFICKPCCVKRGADMWLWDFPIGYSRGRCQLCKKGSICIDYRGSLAAPGAKPAPSEDEGEALAKRLRQIIFCAFVPPLVERVDFGGIDKRLDQLDADTQRHIKDVALRFRDECVGPWKELEDAARAAADYPLDNAKTTRLHECLMALGRPPYSNPDQGEAGEDKPRPSDDEPLGWAAWHVVLAMLDPGCVSGAQNNYELARRIGAAIREKLET